MPGSDGGVVRYTYGEWDWYAREEQGAWRGMVAMLWPTRGALGRQEYPVDAPPLPPQVTPEGREQVYQLSAESEQVAALRERLDRRFEAGRDGLIYAERYDLDFVPDPQDYWMMHQSNLVTADWLRQLDITVSGSPWLSRWSVETR